MAVVQAADRLANELLDLERDFVLCLGAAAGLPLPEEANASPMPSDHGVWLAHHESVRPAGTRPERAGARSHGRRGAGVPGWGPAEGGKLLAQGEVRKRKLGVGAEGPAQGGEQVHKEAEHGGTMPDGGGCLPRPWICRLTDGEARSRVRSWRTTTETKAEVMVELNRIELSAS